MKIIFFFVLSALCKILTLHYCSASEKPVSFTSSFQWSVMVVYQVCMNSFTQSTKRVILQAYFFTRGSSVCAVEEQHREASTCEIAEQGAVLSSVGGFFVFVSLTVVKCCLHFTSCLCESTANHTVTKRRFYQSFFESHLELETISKSYRCCMKCPNASAFLSHVKKQTTTPKHQFICLEELIQNLPLGSRVPAF